MLCFSTGKTHFTVLLKNHALTLEKGTSGKRANFVLILDYFFCLLFVSPISQIISTTYCVIQTNQKGLLTRKTTNLTPPLLSLCFLLYVLSQQHHKYICGILLNTKNPAYK